MSLLEFLQEHKIPIISFIGFSHSGKTASIESVIQAVKSLNYQCVVLKKTNHTSPIFDTPGKNTWKYSQKGAKMVIGRTRVEIATFLNKEFTETQFDQFSSGLIKLYVDIFPSEKLLVVGEGFRNLNCPQILCAKDLTDIDKQFNANTIAISGKISSNHQMREQIVQKFNIPVINCLHEPEKILNLLNVK